MMFLKFGKKEHLEQLKNGEVHFRPIETFQEDVTTFRGDAMEGKVYYDLRHPLIINGLDISPFAKDVVMSYDMGGTILTFSAAILCKGNCHRLESGLYAPNESFIEEMRQFGDWFLLFSGYELITDLKAALKTKEASIAWHPIHYCDKRNPDEVQKYFSSCPEGDEKCAHLFLKDNSYSKQYEWRMAIIDVHKQFPISSNGGTNIKTGFYTKMPVMETNVLHTLECDEAYLFD